MKVQLRNMKSQRVPLTKQKETLLSIRVYTVLFGVLLVLEC
jgi:hypothetical protein